MFSWIIFANAQHGVCLARDSGPQAFGHRWLSHLNVGDWIADDDENGEDKDEDKHNITITLALSYGYGIGQSLFVFNPIRFRPGIFWT